MKRSSSTIDSIVSSSSHSAGPIVIPQQSSPFVSSVAEKNAIVVEKTNRLIDRFSRSIENYTNEELNAYLKEDMEELRHLDPMIPALRKIEEGSWSPNEDTIHLGTYRVSSPPIKALNDMYLGPIATDRFIDHLHAAIENTFRANFEVLRRFFKGGTFNLKMSKTGDMVAHLEELRKSMSTFHEKATCILQGHISEQLNVYEQALEKQGCKVMGLALDELETYIETRSPSPEQDKLIASYRSLRYFAINIAEGRIPVEISFGINETRSVSPKEISFAMCSSERAANMGTYRNYESRKLGGTNGHERNPLQEYAHEFLFADLIAARSKIQELAVEGEGASLRIKPEWEPFFKLDRQGRIRMRQKMIAQLRKGEYDDNLDPNAITAFFSYYSAINEVDVLRNFRVTNFDQYLKRSQQIHDLTKEAQAALDDPATPRTILESILQRTSDELEISIKNEDEKKIISRTHRAVIRALMADGPKVFFIGDHVGFGIKNIQSYEESVVHLIEKLHLTDEEMNLNTRNHRQFLSLLKQRLSEMDNSFWETLFGIGDSGTAHLRKTEAAMVHYFDQAAISDSNGGDELPMVIPVPNKGLPDKSFFDVSLNRETSRTEQDRLMQAVNLKLNEVAGKARLRAAVVLMTEPIRTGEGDRYVRALRYAEWAHGYLKHVDGVYVLSTLEKELAEKKDNDIV
jgi:hypothetical protein